MKWILVAVDGSESAKQAQRHAADLARKLGEGLLLAYVVEPPSVPPEGAFPMTEMLNDHEAWARRYLEGEAAALTASGLQVKTELAIGAPAEMLARLAEPPAVDMVVVGSRGRNALARLVLGSVATRLSHICPKPLLIVSQRQAPKVAAAGEASHGAS
jgi:nucleotide-binding universal stress UspA family protein